MFNVLSKLTDLVKSTFQPFRVNDFFLNFFSWWKPFSGSFHICHHSFLFWLRRYFFLYCFPAYIFFLSGSYFHLVFLCNGDWRHFVAEEAMAEDKAADFAFASFIISVDSWRYLLYPDSSISWSKSEVGLPSYYFFLFWERGFFVRFIFFAFSYFFFHLHIFFSFLSLPFLPFSGFLVISVALPPSSSLLVLIFCDVYRALGYILIGRLSCCGVVYESPINQLQQHRNSHEISFFFRPCSLSLSFCRVYEMAP